MQSKIEKITVQKQNISTAVLFQSFKSLSNYPEIDVNYLEEKL